MTEPDSTRQSPRVEASVRLSTQFRAVFDAEFAYVCRSLQRLGVRSGDVPDVAQELFLMVHRALPEYDPKRPVRPWLCGFSVRFAANYRRLGRLADLPGEAADRRTIAPSNEVEARDLVFKILDRLDFDRRSVIVMHDMEGFAAPEIAEALGVPLSNTVYSPPARLAREDLKAAAAQLQEEGGLS